MRTELALSYAQVGVLLSAPAIVASLIEPAFGILGDSGDRRTLVRGGGAAFAAALVLIALGTGFWPLLAALVLLYPASGAFVGLSQATLMDADPGGRERSMARWALAGSLGALGGPLLVGAADGVGLGWRAVVALLAVATVPLVVLLWRAPEVPHRAAAGPRAPRPPTSAALARGAREAWRALRRREVVRWLVLLEVADLLNDVLLAFLALYLVDVAGASAAWAGIAVAVWTGAGLLGTALLIPLLERVSGVRYVRASAVVALAAFPAFLVVAQPEAKLALLALLGALTSGWYPVLQGRLYDSVPGQSATVLALNNVAGLASGLLPLAIGLTAERHGLGAALWLLLAAPAALLTWLPRRAA